MANLQKVNDRNFFDSVLPSFGNYRKVNTPNYDNSQRMFIIDEYESAAGHRSYRGMRLSEHVVFVETVGLYHTWTYINSLELYIYNGERIVLVQKKSYDKVFRNEANIKSDSEEMLRDYLHCQAKMTGTNVASRCIKQRAHELVEACYTSLHDKNFEFRLTKILPALELTNNNQKLIR